MIDRNRDIAVGTTIANVILAAGGLACLLVSAYFLYFYAWTHERRFTSPMGPALYYFLPGGLAIMLFASLRLIPVYKTKIALLVASTAFSVFMAELFLNLFAPPPTPWLLARPPSERKEIAEKFGVDFDTRDGKEVVLDLRRKGVDAYPKTSPWYTQRRNSDGTLQSLFAIDGVEFLPLASISNKTLPGCNENGTSPLHKTDEHGFTNPMGMWSQHIEIVTLGDSMTEGTCVPDDQSFVAFMRQEYPDILNLGQAGLGPLLTLAVLKEYVPHARPSMVLWFYCESNDLTDLQVEMENPMLRRYLEKGFSQGLFDRQADIDRVLIAYTDKALTENPEATEEGKVNAGNQMASKLKAALLATVSLKTLRTRVGVVYGESTSSASVYSETVHNLFRDVLVEAKSFTEGLGGKLYFIYLPDWQRYANPGGYHNDRDRILTLVNTIGIPILDVHEAFHSHGDPLSLFPFRQPGHYTEAGNRLVAQQTIRFISTGR